MAIIVNLDVIMVKRKISSNELAEKIGITPANLSILKTLVFVESRLNQNWRTLYNGINSSYLFPFALLCVLHNIWQFSISVEPPLLHAVTWSASISFRRYILVLFAPSICAQYGQLETCSASAFAV